MLDCLTPGDAITGIITGKILLLSMSDPSFFTISFCQLIECKNQSRTKYRNHILEPQSLPYRVVRGKKKSICFIYVRYMRTIYNLTCIPVWLYAWQTVLLFPSLRNEKI